MRFTALIILILGFCSPISFSATDPPHMILIIRHAEKPNDTADEKDPNLSKQGFQRADALVKVIPDHFARPDFLIATKKSKNSNRPVETLTPLSQSLHESIDSTFKDDEFAELAHAVLTDPKYSGKTVLIAWHHGKIPVLAKALGIENAPDQWNPSVFDRIWQITFENTTPAWKNLPEHALPGDSEN